MSHSRLHRLKASTDKTWLNMWEYSTPPPSPMTTVQSTNLPAQTSIKHTHTYTTNRGIFCLFLSESGVVEAEEVVGCVLEGNG